MVSILDTSHSPICPYGSLEQSPFGNISRHVRTASLSSITFFGENAGGARDGEGLQPVVWEAKLVLNIGEVGRNDDSVGLRCISYESGSGENKIEEYAPL